MISRTSPSLLIVDEAPQRLADRVAALAAAGWTVVCTTDGAKLSSMAAPPALLLLPPTAAGLELARAIRRRTDHLASIPILALLAEQSAQPAVEYDGALSRSAPAEVWLTTAAAWRPDADDALDRLEAMFGAAQIRTMAAQLRDLLGQGLEALGTADAAPLAHRLAGVAGTLGFATAGNAWRQLSEGVAGAETVARRESRRAIATIDRRAFASKRST